MQYKRVSIWFALLAAALAAVPDFASASPVPQQSANRLTNPGFEGDYVSQSATVAVASGWTAWWLPHQEGQPDFVNRQPNFEETMHPERVHGGSKAQLLASFYETHTAGVYQRVSVTPGADLRFSAFGKGWTSTNDDPLNVSVGGTELRLRVGIDPTGGTDPLSPNVLWSTQASYPDAWIRFEVYARAQSSTVTVFVYSSPFDARRHNDVYWDDAELVSLSGSAAATAQASYPTPTPLPIIPTATPVTLAAGQNLLVNPGFEGSWFNPCSWKGDLPWNHISCTPWYKELMTRWDTVYTPEGWTGWWQIPITDTARSDYWTYPSSCDKPGRPKTCVPWHNPEYGGTDWIINGPPRIRSGEDSLKYFTFWSVHEAGVFQTVGGLTPGTVLRFSAWIHAWSASEGPNREQPSPFRSEGQTGMHMKIGIDPRGGRNPWSSDIVWSAEVDTYDQFGYYQVTAAAASDRVTVYIYSRPEKDNKHNDLYVDDTELVAVTIPGGSAAPAVVPTQSAPPGNPAPPAAPIGPPTSRPDGSVVHTVQSGETLWGISVQYGVSMEQIMQLNGIAQDTILLIGQELVVALSSAANPPAPEPTQPPDSAPEAAQDAAATRR